MIKKYIFFKSTKTLFFSSSFFLHLAHQLADLPKTQVYIFLETRRKREEKPVAVSEIFFVLYASHLFFSRSINVNLYTCLLVKKLLRRSSGARPNFAMLRVFIASREETFFFCSQCAKFFSKRYLSTIIFFFFSFPPTVYYKYTRKLIKVD